MDMQSSNERIFSILQLLRKDRSCSAQLIMNSDIIIFSVIERSAIERKDCDSVEAAWGQNWLQRCKNGIEIEIG